MEDVAGQITHVQIRRIPAAPARAVHWHDILPVIAAATPVIANPKDWLARATVPRGAAPAFSQNHFSV